LKKTIHIIPSLESGGAERMLSKLVTFAPENHIVLYSQTGSLKAQLVDEEVKLHQFNNVFQLIDIVSEYHRHNQVKCVVAWLYKACFYSYILKFKFYNIKIIFNHRNTLDDINTKGLKRRISLFALKLLNKKADGVIFNSNSGYHSYKSRGIVNLKSQVLNNGFELEKFTPSRKTFEEERRKFGFRGEDIVYIISARYDHVKQIELIIDAFTSFSYLKTNVKLLVCGRGTSILREHYSSNKIKFLGEVTDVSLYYKCSNYLILFSKTEGFPNVVGEAMAVGLPCLVSDVGDCRELVEGRGWISNKGTISELKAMLDESYSLTPEEYSKLSSKCSEHIISNYSIESIYQKYELYFEEVVNEYK
jgi:glycosyltransferase involved in cell wall biosynthesis